MIENKQGMDLLPLIGSNLIIALPHFIFAVGAGWPRSIALQPSVIYFQGGFVNGVA